MADTDAEEQSEENEAEAEEKGGGKTKLIVAAVVLVVLGVGGFFAAPAIMNMISPPAGEEEEAVAEPAANSDKPALFAPLHPPLVINFKSSDGESHFMQLTLEVMARDQAVIDEVKNHAAVIRNSLILMYGNVDYESVVTREGKEQMLADALTEIRTILEAETGKTDVEAVYFTSLIIQ